MPRIIVLLLLILVSSSAMDIDKFTTPTTICGYLPFTKIRDYAVLDLDHEAIRHRLTLGEISKARNLYEMGGNAFPVARLTLQAPRDAYNFPTGTKVYGVAKSHDRTVFGTLLEPVSWEEGVGSNITLEVAYFTSLFDDLPEENQCRVGGYYTFERANMNGCTYRWYCDLIFADAMCTHQCTRAYFSFFPGFTDESGTVELVLPTQSQGHGQVFSYEYNIRHDNVNYRTLQSLSTHETAGHKSCPDCPYFDDFAQYLDYYGGPDFGNRWILAAASYDTTEFASQRGQANFGSTPKIGVAEAMIIGILGFNVLLQIIQGVEQASARCVEGCGSILCNEESIHLLDQSVALYCGSIEGQDGTGEGVFQYALAQRRSAEFGVNNPGTTTNDRLMGMFQDYQDLLLQGSCAEIELRKKSIISLLKVPLVQSVLRFAYIRDSVPAFDVDDSPKAEAFGATYAAVVLPLVHKCHRADANTIYENLRMGSEDSAVSFHRVKEALENNYECMGISCDDIGGIWTDEGFAEGAGPCGIQSNAITNKKNSLAITAVSFLGVSLTVMVVMFGAYFYVKKRKTRGGVEGGIRRRRGHVRGTSGTGNIAAVSNIT
eukprot:scaffold3591_cov159-Amphora_coffeaeformis.AAC.8